MKEKLEKEDLDDKITERNCIVLAQQLSAMKKRADDAEKQVVEEKERYMSFREKVQRDVGGIINRTRRIGAPREEV